MQASQTELQGLKQTSFHLLSHPFPPSHSTTQTTNFNSFSYFSWYLSWYIWVVCLYCYFWISQFWNYILSFHDGIWAFSSYVELPPFPLCPLFCKPLSPLSSTKFLFPPFSPYNSIPLVKTIFIAYVIIDLSSVVHSWTMCCIMITLSFWHSF